MDVSAPVTYEVNLRVDASIEAEYRAWLQAHVRELLALPGFLDATVFDVHEPAEPGRTGLCVHYRLRDMAALERYLDEDAPRMREAGTARFGGRFSASRRVLVAR